MLDTLSCLEAVAVSFGGFFRGLRLRKELVMLVELRVAEQRYRAVWEVLDGASVTEVARRFGVSRQSVHVWLNRYAAEGGLGGLGDLSSRPHSCLVCHYQLPQGRAYPLLSHYFQDHKGIE